MPETRACSGNSWPHRASCKGRRATEVGAPPVKLVVRHGKGHGWGDFWKSHEDVTLFVEWFDEYLRGMKK